MTGAPYLHFEDSKPGLACVPACLISSRSPRQESHVHTTLDQPSSPGLYKFTPLEDLADIRASLIADCEAAGIKGTLLLAPEGVNGTIAGTREGIGAALDAIRRLPGCADIEHKESWAHADEPPFQKLKVRLKTEIVRMGVPDIDPNLIVGTYVEPENWNALIAAPDVITIDTRNTYEVGIGTFEGAVHQNFIKPVAEELGLDAKRSDEIGKSGIIQKEMIVRIISNDIVIVDISTLNANVFYELGIRHTARKSGTILLRRKGQYVPFNIQGMRVVEYPDFRNDPEWQSPANGEAVESARDELSDTILNSLGEHGVDSLVHSLVPGLNVSLKPRPLSERVIWQAPLDQNTKKAIGFITGDLLDIDMVDAWVNPECTRMDMARIDDNSISAAIRYYGASRDSRGIIRQDDIASALSRRTGGDRASVEPGVAIITEAGKLTQSHNVRAIVHVAAQHGEPGAGYHTVQGLATCIDNALDAIDSYNRSLLTKFHFRPAIQSVIFPLFGTQNIERDSAEVTRNLVRTAARYLSTWPKVKIQEIYFLAYTNVDLELCQTAFRQLKLEPNKIDDHVPESQTA